MEQKCQELTTKQVEFLILVQALNNYRKESNDEIVASNKEIITQDGYMDVETVEDLENKLIEFGYLTIEEDYELTIAGQQYLDLFTEHLEEKTEKPNITVKLFTLIDLEKLQLSLEANLAKLNLSGEIFKINNLLSVVNQKIRSLRQ